MRFSTVFGGLKGTSAKVPTMAPQKLHLHSRRGNKVYAVVKAEKTYFDFELKTEPQDITMQVLHTIILTDSILSCFQSGLKSINRKVAL